MSRKTRLDKLEAKLGHETEPLNVATFVVPVDSETLGYTCGDIQIMRRAGESVDDLQQRCIASVVWPSGNSILLFNLME